VLSSSQVSSFIDRNDAGVASGCQALDIDTYESSAARCAPT
jgi:hypothetical protein